MNKKAKTFLATARSWISENQIHGPHAFLRFVMLAYVQRLNDVTDEFVFKGGNLLWLYIKTPRATVDVDFVTKSLANHGDVRKKLEEVCQKPDANIQFSIKSFRPIEQQGGLGAAVTIGYVTSEGQANTFDLDIVYAIPTSIANIKSPIRADESICVATMENIISDKISACHRFKSGNTRMKDFDDLWRISMFHPSPVNWALLKEILESRGIVPSLNLSWQNPQMEKSWEAHVRRNKGLPTDLSQLMDTVNDWLRSGLGK
ncbi:MAG: nucleotidyl transferase AbiEii/AbiGii toxin family protein [Proteobacteria bacterium]|nr:nucleotidyl transferase AbiEii/AbiGii toxin family protein [Pseudomonadota bacterium]